MTNSMIKRLTVIVFWAALIFAFVEAIIPAPQEMKILPSDKMMHFLAFYTLSLLAVLAYPRAALWKIAIRLSGLGALIEIIQAIPFIHRDCDFGDWVADTVAILAALIPAVAFWWRAKSTPAT